MISTQIMYPINLVNLDPRNDITSRLYSQRNLEIKTIKSKLERDINNNIDRLTKDLLGDVPSLLTNGELSKTKITLIELTNQIKTLEIYSTKEEILSYQKSFNFNIEGIRELLDLLERVGSLFLNTVNGNEDINTVFSQLSNHLAQLDKIISAQDFSFIEEDSAEDVLLILDGVIKQCSLSPESSVFIKNYTLSIFGKKKLSEFLSDFCSSTDKLIWLMENHLLDRKYIDIDNSELINFISGIIPTQDANNIFDILQLGCELLKIGGVQEALGIFEQKYQNDLIRAIPEFQFDFALALTQSSEAEQRSRARTILDNIEYNDIVTPNKVNFLLTINCDSAKDYINAEKYYEAIQDYTPETLFEKMVSIKYQYKKDIERWQQELHLLQNQHTSSFDKVLIEYNDADLYFILGNNYFSNNEPQLAEKYFSQCCHIILDNTLIVKSENIYPLSQMINFASCMNNTLFFNLIKEKFKDTKCYIEALKNSLTTFIIDNDISKTNYLLNNADLNELYSHSINIASTTNNLELIESLLENEKIDFDQVDDNGLKPIQYAARRTAHEDGNGEILESFLMKYRDSLDRTLNEDLFSYIDLILQHGPSYIQNQFEQSAKELLGIDVPQNSNESYDW